MGEKRIYTFGFGWVKMILRFWEGVGKHSKHL